LSDDLQIGTQLGADPQRWASIVESLVRDGLIEVVDRKTGCLVLAGDTSGVQA
jgi:hypothetical protein